MVMQPPLQRGPAKKLADTAKNAVRTLVEICQTRLELVIVELEEEKYSFFKLFFFSAVCMLFSLFGVFITLALTFWSVPPELRFEVFMWIGGLLFFFSFLTGGWVLFKIRNLSLFQDTRKQLKKDLKVLGVSDD